MLMAIRQLAICIWPIAEYQKPTANHLQMLIKNDLQQAAVQLLTQLIATPSFSKEESATADIIASFFENRHIPFQRSGNNIWAKNRHWGDRPVVLLNSHHDTVRPMAGWQRDPFQPTIEDGKLFGLGSNDAGASLVSLLAVFLHFHEMENLPYNLLFLAFLLHWQGWLLLWENWPPMWCFIPARILLF